jgi:hypothetical protein
MNRKKQQVKLIAAATAPGIAAVGRASTTALLNCATRAGREPEHAKEQNRAPDFFRRFHSVYLRHDFFALGGCASNRLSKRSAMIWKQVGR